MGNFSLLGGQVGRVLPAGNSGPNASLSLLLIISPFTRPERTQAAPPPPDPTVPPAQRPTMLGKAWAAALPQLPPGVRLRPGRPEDAPLLSKAVLREKMNPLGLKPERFTVAEREGSGAVVGFGQVRPLGGEGAQELASLVVEEAERGRGVGSALISSLVQQAGDAPLYLVTIGSRVQLYRRCGFEEVPASRFGTVPLPLLLEALAGTVVAWLAVRQRLALMQLVSRGGTTSSSTAGAAQSAAAGGDAAAGKG